MEPLIDISRSLTILDANLDLFLSLENNCRMAIQQRETYAYNINITLIFRSSVQQLRGFTRSNNFVQKTSSNIQIVLLMIQPQESTDLLHEVLRVEHAAIRRICELLSQVLPRTWIIVFSETTPLKLFISVRSFISVTF